MTKVANAPLSLPANFSISGALAQGMLSHNTQVISISGVAVSKSLANPTVAHLMSIGLLNPAMPASVLGVAPHFGGD